MSKDVRKQGQADGINMMPDGRERLRAKLNRVKARVGDGLSKKIVSQLVDNVPYRVPYALAKEMMSLPCNKNHADKTFVYERQAAYNAYFRELKK